MVPDGTVGRKSAGRRAVPAGPRPSGPRERDTPSARPSQPSSLRTLRTAAAMPGRVEPELGEDLVGLGVLEVGVGHAETQDRRCVADAGELDDAVGEVGARATGDVPVLDGDHERCGARPPRASSGRRAARSARPRPPPRRRVRPAGRPPRWRVPTRSPTARTHASPPVADPTRGRGPRPAPSRPSAAADTASPFGNRSDTEPLEVDRRLEHRDQVLLGRRREDGRGRDARASARGRGRRGGRRRRRR